jgi:hypothetical protein
MARCDAPGGDETEAASKALSWRRPMRLSAPKEITFIIAFIVAAVAFLIAASVITNPLPTVAVVWIALAAYAILALGNLLRRL